jgi:hypothetical protein
MILSPSILGSVPGQQLDARAWRKFSWSKRHCGSAVPGLRGTKLSYAGSMSSRQAHHTAFRGEVRRDKKCVDMIPIAVDGIAEDTFRPVPRFSRLGSVSSVPPTVSARSVHTPGALCPRLCTPRLKRGRGAEQWYDVAIMMSRTQITLENEVQRRARQRASELGVSLAEYVRRLVARDLARPETAIAVDRIFDLGSSGGADIAMDKDSMIAEAFQAKRRKTKRR